MKSNRIKFKNYEEDNYAYWSRPVRNSKLRNRAELPVAWFILGWALSFLVFYPIASHMGYWTSAIPAALVIGTYIGILVNVFHREYEE